MEREESHWINPSGHAVIGFTITCNAGVPSGTTCNITASITPNSGGDINFVADQLFDNRKIQILPVAIRRTIDSFSR
ncbi:hypothetical protein [Dyadobacter sediminis]|uniref:Uncharacterized protein n=1 Tax=Dyadobacter sediminis TaxID=1493691 RepID=A0A5R9K7H1_9BACT|nr:hypothetical protein [Dyadobacter sediminis]TLU89804.1 hypothetical protein FEM55_19915 [Dyadobacter sediminis]